MAEAKICHMEREIDKGPQASLAQDASVASDKAKIQSLEHGNNALRTHLKNVLLEKS